MNGVSLPAMAPPPSPSTTRTKEEGTLAVMPSSPTPQTLRVAVPAYMLGGMGLILSVLTWLLANVVPPTQSDAQLRVEHVVKRARRSSLPILAPQFRTRSHKRASVPPPPRPIIAQSQAPHDRHVYFADAAESTTPARRDPSPPGSLSDTSTLVNAINLALEDCVEGGQSANSDSKQSRPCPSFLKMNPPVCCKSADARSSTSSLDSSKPTPAYLKRSTYLSALTPRLSRLGKKKRGSSGSVPSSVASSDTEADPLKFCRAGAGLPAPGWSRSFGWPTTSSPAAESAPSTPGTDGQQSFFGSAPPSRCSSLTRRGRAEVVDMASNRASSSLGPSPMSETCSSGSSSRPLSRPPPSRSASVSACNFRRPPSLVRRTSAEGKVQEPIAETEGEGSTAESQLADSPKSSYFPKLPKSPKALKEKCKARERRRQSAPVPIPRTQPYGYPYFAAPPVVRERGASGHSRSSTLPGLSQGLPSADTPLAGTSSTPVSSGPTHVSATTPARRKRTLSSPTKPNLTIVVPSPVDHRLVRPSTANGTFTDGFGVMVSEEEAAKAPVPASVVDARVVNAQGQLASEDVARSSSLRRHRHRVLRLPSLKRWSAGEGVLAK